MKININKTDKDEEIIKHLFLFKKYNHLLYSLMKLLKLFKSLIILFRLLINILCIRISYYI